jgi:hypothetical protein
LLVVAAAGLAIITTSTAANAAAAGPIARGFTATTTSYLFGVSCVTPTSCNAAGYYFGTTNSYTLIEKWNGRQWSIVPSPNLNVRTNALRGISCATSSFCTAVGYQQDAHSPSTLIEVRNGASWAIVPSVDLGADLLYDVSCTSANFCVAVGIYLTSSNLWATLIEGWDGNSWGLMPSPNVDPGTTDNFLRGVSCVSVNSCTAVGDTTLDGVGAGQTLIEQWDGTGWSIVPSPNVGSTDNHLDGASCVSASFCTAVGNYSNHVGGAQAQTLVETWDGSNWSVVSSPSLPGTGMNLLNGVSCISTKSCTAVGDHSGGGNQTLIETWDGTNWSIVQSPNAGLRDFLFRASCTSTTSCVAAGLHGRKTLIEAWNGTSWSIARSRNVLVD